MSQQKHTADAERRRQFRYPKDKELSQQKHTAGAERRRQFSNTVVEKFTRERQHAEAKSREAEIIRGYERRLPGQLARAQKTP